MQQYAISLMVVVALPIVGHCAWSSRRLSRIVGQTGSQVPIKSPVPTSHSISGHAEPSRATQINGWVDLNGKIDLRSLTEQLHDIPEILHLLRNITNKIEFLDKDFSFDNIRALISSLTDSVRPAADEISETIHKDVHALQEPIESTGKQVHHIVEFLEQQSQKPVQCELTEFENGFDLFAHTVEDMITQLQQQVTAEMTKEEQGLSGIRENRKILMDIHQTLIALTDKSKGFGNRDGECSVCQKLDGILHKVKENGNRIHQLGNTEQILPHEIVALIKEGFGSIRKDIQALTKNDESIKGSLAQLNKHIEAHSAKLDRHFSQNRKVIVETQSTVVETVKAVKKTAASAEQAVKKIVQEATKAVGRSAARNCEN